MPIYKESKNWQPGLAGPLYGWSYNQKLKGSCDDPCSCSCKDYCCDVSITLDMGNKQTIGFDWNDFLLCNGECKVLKSEWYVAKEASIPLQYTNPQYNQNITSLQIAGGTNGGEYVLVNKITTEEGNTYDKVFCVTTQSCLTGTMTQIDTNTCSKGHYSAPQRDICLTPAAVEIEQVLNPGIYQNLNLCGGPICCLNLVLVEGCARFIDTSTYDITKEGLSVSNDGSPLENFIIVVDECSMVKYTFEEC